MEKLDILSAALSQIKERGLFKSITRPQSPAVDVQKAIEVVEAIGKSRTEKFCIDTDNRFAYENLIRWVHGDPKMQCLCPKTKKIVAGNLNRGIYLSGTTGSGKSWALEIMAAYAMVLNFKISIGNETRSLYWGNFRADNISVEFSQKGEVEQYKQMKIMGIQDLGAEPQESLFMGNRANVLRQIIEYRGDRTDLVTLATSNLPMNHKWFIERYGDRVSSRLNEMCNYFEIVGKDRRMV